jgi:PLP dependent protein
VTFLERLDGIRDRIVEAGGDPDRVRIVAVSKGQPIEAITEAIDAGQRDFGENYADELVEKALQVPKALGVRWHFQGNLQTNKINRLVPHVAWWHTIDSTERAQALGQRSPGATVLVQLNSMWADAPQRAGCTPSDAADVVQHARNAGLNVIGLMTIAPYGTVDDASAAIAAFRQLAEVADALELPERSMGMSSDLESAIKAGATVIRVGGALFGPRR